MSQGSGVCHGSLIAPQLSKFHLGSSGSLVFHHVSTILIILCGTRPDVAAAKSAAQKLGYAEAGFRTIREVFDWQMFDSDDAKWTPSILTQHSLCQKNKKSNDLRILHAIDKEFPACVPEEIAWVCVDVLHD